MATIARIKQHMTRLVLFSLGVGSGVCYTHLGQQQDASSPVVAHTIVREGYQLAYDGQRRNPYYVCELITKESVQGTLDRSKVRFKEDTLIPTHIRAHLDDYKGSGLDRGHMAAAQNQKWSPKALEESFFLSNVCPQDPKCNRKTWAALEKEVRNLTASFASIRLYTGPLYLPETAPDGKRYVHYQVIGQNDVAVPTHFFKLLRLQRENGTVSYKGFIVPNRAIDGSAILEQFEATKEEIERLSGILFVE